MASLRLATLLSCSGGHLSRTSRRPLLTLLLGVTVDGVRQGLGSGCAQDRDGGECQRMPSERRALQEYGDTLDIQTGGSWVAEAVACMVSRSDQPEPLVIVDSVRRMSQIDALRSAFPRVDHIHVFASTKVLGERYLTRGARSGLAELSSYAEVAENATERQVSQLAEDADVSINTDHCDSGACQTQ
jgi:adenylosuccinate synthase